MAEMIQPIIRKCRFTVWYYILMLLAKVSPKDAKCPNWLKGKTAFVIKYSNGDKTTVKLS